jgi:hypothetical protein
MILLIKSMYVKNLFNMNSVKNLCIYIDEHLNWSHQINFLCKKMFTITSFVFI